MQPAFSVIFLTTLIGAAQGLFLALYGVQVGSAVKLLPQQGSTQFYATGSLIVLLLLIAGLVSSFFHLGHPERAWRAASCWRTSWLSREVIALPVFMTAVFGWGLLHYTGWDPVLLTFSTGMEINLSLLLGAFTVLLCLALFLCTGMIYACIRMLQEWATPLTVINYTVLGGASGLTLATVFAAWQSSEMTAGFAGWAMALTTLGLMTRSASLIRNGRLRYKSTLQTALGINNPNIQQKAQGAMTGSFNTREYFHGASKRKYKSIKWLFLLLVFPLPVVLLRVGIESDLIAYLIAALLFQYIGLLLERWFFFAQANHPQNLYYQTV